MCAWKKSSDIAQTQITRRGFRETVTAVQMCQEAERVSSVPLHAVSYRSGILKIRIRQENLISMKLVQGRLMEELNGFALTNHLPPVKRLLIDIEP